MNANGVHRTAENGSGSSRHPAAVTLAAELRALRERAGSPSYRQLAKATNFSASTLAEAAAGRRLPTEQVIRALAQAYGDDPDRWAAKLREAPRLASTPAAERLERPPSSPRAATDPLITRVLSLVAGRALRYGLAALLIAIAGFATGAATMNHGADKSRRAAIGPGPMPQSSSPATVGPPTPDGADPIIAGCTSDAQLIDKTAILNQGEQVGALELKYSRRCGAGWSRVYLYPTGVKPFSGTVTEVDVEALDGTATSFTAPLHNQVSNYTGVIQPHSGCLRAHAQLRPAGHAPITVAIACVALPAIAPTRT